MKDTRPWWAQWRTVYFELMTLTTAAPWDPPKGHAHRVYSDGTFSFRESEIAGNFDEVEEQLWSFRNGLSNVTFELKINTRRKPPASKYKAKHNPSRKLWKRDEIRRANLRMDIKT